MRLYPLITASIHFRRPVTCGHHTELRQCDTCECTGNPILALITASLLCRDPWTRGEYHTGTLVTSTRWVYVHSLITVSLLFRVTTVYLFYITTFFYSSYNSIAFIVKFHSCVYPLITFSLTLPTSRDM